MNYQDYLDFEQPIAALQEKIGELQRVNGSGDMDFGEELARLRQKSEKLTARIYGGLKPWDIVRVARHPQRPYSGDYIQRIITDFQELHGDRHFGDDRSVICGFGRLAQRPVLVIGQEKGRGTKERVQRNFGMLRPEGYRKARRLMELAERFGMPVLSFIDTPGAFPGIEAEERGISEAIAGNLALMSRLRTPMLCTVIGEGSSGGALGIGIGDHLCMLQYATYFVISPEGCANIVWKTSDKAPEAAEAMGLTSASLQKLGIVDTIIEEPLGGAHRDYDLIAKRVGEHLTQELDRLAAVPIEDLLQQRYQRLLSYGNP